VNIRFLQNPTTKSLSIHLLLLMMIALVLWMLPEIKTSQEPISLNLIEKKHSRPQDFSNKTVVAKENKSARTVGASSTQAASMKTISVSDLGMKLNHNQTNSLSSPKSWTSHVMSNAMVGGDYVEDAKQDEVSILNSKESIYSSFFDRFQHQLLGVTDPIYEQALAKISRSNRQIPAQDRYVTRTLVKLNHKGEIVKVQVLRGSGIIELDSAALVALNKAGPYPNPPKGLTDADGNAEFPLSFIIGN